jgi:hypothetical protein
MTTQGRQTGKGGVRTIGPITMPWRYDRWTDEDVRRLEDAILAGLVELPLAFVLMARIVHGVPEKWCNRLEKAERRAKETAEQRRQDDLVRGARDLGATVAPIQVANVHRLKTPPRPPQKPKHADRPLCLSCAGGCALGPVPWPKWAGGQPPEPPPFPEADDPDVIAERAAWEETLRGPLEERWKVKRHFTPPGSVCDVTGREGPCWRPATPAERDEEITFRLCRDVHQRRVLESRVEYDAAVRMFYDPGIRAEIAKTAAKQVCAPCLAIHVEAKCKSINKVADKIDAEINQRSSP